ncbi:MAG: hypothetical protein IPP78_01340 [Holophagaceae bacterium]|nr:hypothetical protein [Holophagaceae bacterium]
MKIADYVASSVFSYFAGDILDRLKREKDSNKQIFIGSIHADVVNIVNRIDASGGIETIQIGAPTSNQPMFAAFSVKQRDYVNSLSNTYYLGKKQIIKGNVYRLYPNMSLVTIRRPGGKKVDIELTEQDFESIRYQTGVNPLIAFIGCPKFKFGIEPTTITHFVADSIEVLPQT